MSEREIDQRRLRRPNWRKAVARPLVACIASAIASLAAGWLLTKPQSAAYTSRAMVRETCAAGATIGFDAQAVVTALQSPEHIAAALQTIGAASAPAFGRDVEESTADVVRRLRITAETAPMTRRRTVTIRCLADESTPWAPALVNQLAKDYVASLRASVEARAADELASALADAAHAESEANSARASLDAWLAARLVATKAQGAAHAASQEDRGDSTDPKPSVELLRQLKQLRARREALLERLMPRHPDVKAIDLEIGGVEKKIDQLDQNEATRPTPLRDRHPVAGESSMAWDATSDAQWRTLRDLVTEATARRAEAASKVDSAAVAMSKAHKDEFAQMTPAEVAVMPDDRPEWRNFAIVVAFGLLAACAATWRWPSAPAIVDRMATVAGTADFEAEFGVPVVGVVSWEVARAA
ncbi:MAG TPA: hypothetical protein VGX78_05005 [Pirellulales bacterium]|jgi:hypothetical protein|nr:hypothetical protein [Pirellulales bacterium]